MEDNFINQKIENGLFKRNYYYVKNTKKIYEDGKFTYRVVLHYKSINFSVNRHFGDLEEAKQFKTICIDHINKAKFKNSAGYKNSDKVTIDDYPDNLLSAINISDEEPNYYEEILPNFKRNYDEVVKEGFLTPREIDVIKYRYENFLSLENTGKKIGVSRERVRQIEAKALRKLQYIKKARILLKNQADQYKVLDKQELDKMRQEALSKITLEVAKKILEENGYEYKLRYENYCGPNVPNVPIECLDFSVRTYNCLRRRGIKALKDIIVYDIDELMKIRNLGRKSLKEIISKLKEYGVEKNEK